MRYPELIRPPTSPPFVAWFAAYPEPEHPKHIVQFVAAAISPVVPRKGSEFDECLQYVLDTMCRGFEFRDLGNWRGPVITFARLTAMTAMKWLRRGAAGSFQHLDRAEPQPRSDVERRDECRLCQRALRRMPPGRPRTVIALQLRNWDNHDIANYLGEELETVNSTWAARGRIELKRALDEIRREGEQGLAVGG